MRGKKRWGRKEVQRRKRENEEMVRAEGGKRRKGEKDLQEIKGKEDTEGGGAIE